ncbi:MAG: hypothetical protein AB1589_32455 [Cyanobacteriota bacterium]
MSSHSPFPQIILVPQGAEYKAVCRGLSRVKSPKPIAVPIPVGPKALTQYLEQWQQAEEYLKISPSRVLVMGLCGSLSPHLGVGDIVVYQDCVYQSSESTPLVRECDREFTTWLHHKLVEIGINNPSVVSGGAGELGSWGAGERGSEGAGERGSWGAGERGSGGAGERKLLIDSGKLVANFCRPTRGEGIPLVRVYTSDRIIVSAEQKRHLAQTYNTQVVDMEGFAALEVLSQAGIAVAMLRVISDDSHHNLPNLSSALSPEGSLQPLPLALGMLQQPIASIRLVRGALHGLRVLRNVTSLLFSE